MYSQSSSSLVRSNMNWRGRSRMNHQAHTNAIPMGALCAIFERRLRLRFWRRMMP